VKHGEEIKLALSPDDDPMWRGLSMPIGLYRYLYPCRCNGDCKCEAGR
jgi:hypothetical protein